MRVSAGIHRLNLIRERFHRFHFMKKPRTDFGMRFFQESGCIKHLKSTKSVLSHEASQVRISTGLIGKTVLRNCRNRQKNALHLLEVTIGDRACRHFIQEAFQIGIICVCSVQAGTVGIGTFTLTTWPGMAVPADGSGCCSHLFQLGLHILKIGIRHGAIRHFIQEAPEIRGIVVRIGTGSTRIDPLLHCLENTLHTLKIAIADCTCGDLVQEGIYPVGISILGNIRCLGITGHLLLCLLQHGLHILEIGVRYSAIRHFVQEIFDFRAGARAFRSRPLGWPV